MIVEDNRDLALSLANELQRALSDADPELVLTESDFRLRLPRWVAEPPAMFIVDVMLRWSLPAREMPARPPEVTDAYRAGFRCIEALLREPSTQHTPIIVHTVLDRPDVEHELAALPKNVVFRRKGSAPIIDVVRSLLETAHEVSGANMKVFVVHGRNVEIRETVARFLAQLRVEPIILAEQVSQGRTIVELLEHHADVDYAVILLTGDDLGKGRTQKGNRPRARQNVIFELGFFIAKLGRNRVTTLYEPGVEIPTDYQAVVYVELDKAGAWKQRLTREMRAAGVRVDTSALA